MGQSRRIERKAEVAGSHRTGPVGLVRQGGAQVTGLQPHPGTATAVNDSQAFSESKSLCDSKSE